MKPRNGDDMSKWYIRKMGCVWLVMPPVITEIPNWHKLGGTYTTGIEAHAAFARGGRSWR